MNIVESVELITCDETEVFDLGISNNHNYFVYPPDSDNGVLVHNCHTANAKCFASVISSIKTKYKFGCSATVQRKDKKEFIAFALVGPVTAKSTIEALTPTVYLHKTDLPGKKFPQGNTGWTKTCQYIAQDEDRNELLVKQVIKDLRAGHNIVIPVHFVNHVKLLQKMINKEYGSEICGIFTGGNGGTKNKNERKDVLSEVKLNNIRVVVGIRSLLRLGLNVPAWSCIYLCMPISNEPNLKQETARVCTPKEGKKDPIVRLFVDINVGVSLGCARSSMKHMMKFKYHLASSEDQQRLRSSVLSTSRSRQDNDEPVRLKLPGRSGGLLAE